MSKCEGLAADVGCAGNCCAPLMSQPFFPNREMRLAERVLSEHMLLPAESGIDSGFIWTDQPYGSSCPHRND